jgi:hypothetical protein
MHAHGTHSQRPSRMASCSAIVSAASLEPQQQQNVEASLHACARSLTTHQSTAKLLTPAVDTDKSSHACAQRF